MRLVYDLVDNLQAVVLAARQVLEPNNTLRAYLPITNVDDIRYRLVQSQRLDVAAHARAFGTPSRQIARPGVVEVKGGLPAVSAIDTLTEGELYRARALAGMSNGNALANDVTAAAARTAIAVDNRYEILRGQVLATGVLAIDNGEVIQSADFGVPAANLFAAATPWTDPAADIIGDIETWSARYATSAGANPGRALTSRKVAGLMRRNAGVRQLLAANGQVPVLASVQAITNLLDAYGFPGVVTNDRIIAGVRVIPENRFILLPSVDDAPMGRTLLGITEQAVQLAGAGVLTAGQAPGVTVATLVQDHPIARHVNADAIGLPVLDRPDALVSATVGAF